MPVKLNDFYEDVDDDDDDDYNNDDILFWQNFILEKARPVLAQIGWEDMGDTENHLRK